MSAVKSTLSRRTSRIPASSAPPKVPMMMPGAILTMRGQLTAPCRWWLRALEAAVKTIVAMPVPSARCTTEAGENCFAAKMKARIGTIAAPPPMPSRPLKKPTNAPSAR